MRTVTLSLPFRAIGPAVVALTVALAACGSNNDPVQPQLPPAPTQPPVTPPDPTPVPPTFTTVAEIVAGKRGQVLLYGQTTEPRDNDQDEWWFTDESTGRIALDFPSKHVPTAGRKVVVYGTAESDEVDVIAWEHADARPPGGTGPTTPPDPNPPELKITTVAQVRAGGVFGQIILAGQITGQSDDDCDEWTFADGTGSIELDFPSCHVPQVGIPIYVQGTPSGSNEIDVSQWQPR